MRPTRGEQWCATCLSPCAGLLSSACAYLFMFDACTLTVHLAWCQCSPFISPAATKARRDSWLTSNAILHAWLTCRHAQHMSAAVLNTAHHCCAMIMTGQSHACNSAADKFSDKSISTIGAWGGCRCQGIPRWWWPPCRPRS